MRKYLAEFIGTFVLVFIGCGTVGVTNGVDGILGIIGIAFAFGLAIVAMAYSIGNISGCHVNPAVSLAMWINKKMDGRDFIGYVVSQVLGGVVAAAFLKLIEGMCHPAITNLGVNGFGSISATNIDVFGAIIVEIVLTLIFVLAILGVTSKKEYSSVSGLVIGFSLVLVHIIGIPLTGTSVNPARSLGPALIAGGKALGQVWVFIIAPLVGAVIAAFLWKYLSSDETSKKEKKGKIKF